MGLKVGNVIQTKAATISRSDTTAKTLFHLPESAQIIGVRAFVGTPSDSATSATLTLQNAPIDGSAVAATFASIDAKVDGEQRVEGASLEGDVFTQLGKPSIITGSYAEVGAATTGGDWTVVVEYM